MQIISGTVDFKGSLHCLHDGQIIRYVYGVHITTLPILLQFCHLNSLLAHRKKLDLPNPPALLQKFPRNAHNFIKIVSSRCPMKSTFYNKFDTSAVK